MEMEVRWIEGSSPKYQLDESAWTGRSLNAAAIRSFDVLVKGW